MGKRKRTGNEDSDPLIGQTFFLEPEPEEGQAPRGGFGSQVLPVAELDDFDGTPDDGESYLLTSRKEAAGLLDVFYVPRQLATPPLSATISLAPPPKPQLKRPAEDWRLGFDNSFKRMRKSLRDAEDSVLTDLSYLPLPDADDEAAWHDYVTGKGARPLFDSPPTPESLNGDRRVEQGRSGPRLPLLPVLKMLDQATVFSLIEHFDTWIHQRLERAQSGPSTAFVPPALRRKIAARPLVPKSDSPPAFETLDAQWLFALLATLDDLLAGEELDQLRRLARTCLAVLAAEPTATASDEARAGCWMVVAAVSGVWAQRDLWQDT